MDGNRTIHKEGFVLVALGIIVILLSLMVPDNPVKIDHPWSFIAEARFFPMLIGFVLGLLGIRLAYRHFDAVDKTPLDKNDVGRLVLIIIATCVYLYLIPRVSSWFAGSELFSGGAFILATFLFMAGMLLYLNTSMRARTNILLAVIFTFLGAYILPISLKIKLP